MTNKELFERGVIRQPYRYEGVYEWIAPDNYHFENDGTNYGTVIYGGERLTNSYELVKDE